MDGDNLLENIVSLTPEEHYVAHQLLVKMYPKNIKLLWAVSNMTGNTARMRRNNKLYGWLRRRLRDALIGRIISDESRRKMSENHRGTSMKDRKHSLETRKKMSLASKGKSKSIEHCKALSKAKIGHKRGPHSEKHKQSLRESMKRKKANLNQWNSGFLNNPNYKDKQSEIMKEIWHRRFLGELPMPNIKLGGNDYERVQQI